MPFLCNVFLWLGSCRILEQMALIQHRQFLFLMHHSLCAHVVYKHILELTECTWRVNRKLVAVLTIENERAVCVHLFISASLVMRCGIIPLARNMSTVNKHGIC